MRLPLTRPDIRSEQVSADLAAIIDSGTLTKGPFVAEFERLLAARLGVEFCFTTTSATTALHLSLVAGGIQAGDEVLVSDFTFPATANAVVQVGATPVFVDCLAGSYTLDVEHAASLVTDRTRAIIPVDPFGQPADLAAVADLARSAGLFVVEDAACAIGAAWSDRPCGSWPQTGCFSFHPRKVITTGEGGAISTDDPDLADRIAVLRNHGGRLVGGKQVFEDCGFNYRMSELQAALGASQMRRLDDILEGRARPAKLYHDVLASSPWVTTPSFPPEASPVWQSFVVEVRAGISREDLRHELAAVGIETTLGTYALHTQPAYERFGCRPGMLPNSQRLQEQTLTLPLFAAMGEDEVSAVATALDASVETIEGRGYRR